MSIFGSLDILKFCESQHFMTDDVAFELTVSVSTALAWIHVYRTELIPLPVTEVTSELSPHGRAWRLVCKSSIGINLDNPL